MLLSLVTFLPLLGGLAIVAVGRDPRVARLMAMVVSSATFLISLALFAQFDMTTAEFQFVEEREWIPAFDVVYRMGVDGISLPFVILTAFLTPVCILASWESIQERVMEYMVAFLALESFVIGVFCALDFVLFYILWEAMLIPMFLIIGVWGGPRRVYAALKFFLYTLAGSVLMLIGMLALYAKTGTFSIPELIAADYSFMFQVWCFLGFFVAFAVKVPMWPVHTWLPDAHVEAPTAGSVILAGILLKMGGYGFLRFSLPMFPDAALYFAPAIFGLSLVAIIYTALVALMQTDLKKLIAYSSVSHMGFVTIGIFCFNQQGIEGGIFQMISHGVVSGALFLLVGVVYDQLHTREIKRYGGLVHRMPVYAVIFMIMTMAAVGLPGTSGFVGEFLALMGVYMFSMKVAFFALIGVVLGAAYMLWMYKRVVFGEIVHKDVQEMKDLNPREFVMFIPLILLVLWMGFYPNPVLEVFHASVDNLLVQANTSKIAASAVQVAMH